METQIFQIRKIQTTVNDGSFYLVLPKKIRIEVGIKKGDYVRISKNDINQLVIKKEV